MVPKILALCLLLLFSADALKISHQIRLYNYAWYARDERTGGVCDHDDQCDGLRTCKNSLCEGVARPPKDENYRYDEGITGARCTT